MACCYQVQAKQHHMQGNPNHLQEVCRQQHTISFVQMQYLKAPVRMQHRPEIVTACTCIAKVTFLLELIAISSAFPRNLSLTVALVIQWTV